MQDAYTLLAEEQAMDGILGLDGYARVNQKSVVVYRQVAYRVIASGIRGRRGWFLGQSQEDQHLYWIPRP